MGIVIEYAGSSGKPTWKQPLSLDWDYARFASAASAEPNGGPAATGGAVNNVPLIFESKFAGHGAVDRWMINGKSFPNTETLALQQGQRYRLQFINHSTDDHPVHLHRHSFELVRVGGKPTAGIIKDVVMLGGFQEAQFDFVADHPGLTLFHCHQQLHMDFGFMFLFNYA